MPDQQWFETKTVGDVTVMTLRGEAALDTDNFGPFRDALAEAAGANLDPTKPGLMAVKKKIVINMHEARVLCPGAQSSLKRIGNMLRVRKNNQIVLCEVNESVRQQLSTGELKDLFNFQDTEVEGISSFPA